MVCPRSSDKSALKKTILIQFGSYRVRGFGVVILNFAVEIPNFAVENPNFAVVSKPPVFG